MAQKTIAIGIKISSEGGDKVISNLKDLETELGSLQTKLKTLDFGSAAFKETTTNIQKLKTKIDDIDKSTEGLGAEKRFNAINASVGILTSSIQILSGVIGVVIADTGTLEQVQRAEATAVGILNSTLGILQIRREIADQQLTAAKVKQAALTAATKVATAVQVAYNAVLAANPIGLVIAGVVALTGALYLLFRATSDEVAAEEELNKQLEIQTKLNQELAIEAKKTAQESKIALTILTDNVKQRNLELKAIEDLKKVYPGFNAFLDKNNELTATGIEFLKIQIALEEAQAKLKVLRNKAIDLEIKGQTEVNEVLQDSETFLGKLSLQIRGGLQPLGAYTQLSKDLVNAAKDEQRELNVVNRGIAEQEQAVDDLLGQIAPLNKKLEDQAKKEEQVGKETAKTTEIVDKRRVAIENEISVINKLQSTLEKYGQAELKVQSEILDKQKEVIDEQASYLQSVADKLQSGSNKIIKELQETFFKIIPSEKQAEELKDGYDKLFKVIDESLKAGELDLTEITGFQSFVDFAEKIYPGISEQLINVSEESKLAFIDYFKTLEDRASAVKGIYEGISQNGENVSFTPFASEEDLKNLRSIEELYAKLLLNRSVSGQRIVDIENQINAAVSKTFKIGGDNLTIDEKRKKIIAEINEENKKVQTGDEDTKKLAAERITALNEELTALSNITKEISSQIKGSSEFVIGLRKVGDEAEKNTKKIEANRKAIEAPISPEALQGVKEYFEQNADEFATIFTDIFNNADEYLEKFGKDGVMAIFGGVEEGINDIEGKSRAELEKLASYLRIVGDEFANQFGLEDNPFIKLLNEIEKKLKQLPTETEESFTKTIESIREVADVVLEVFNQILGQMNTLINAQNSLLLEQLEYKQETALALIGEANTESEKENKKIEAERAAVQKKFAKERFEIEKKARIQELQFSLATALSTGANAVLNALALPAPPPIPQLYAGVVGGLTIAQVAIIRDQIQFTQSKAFVGRRGGLIMGESHEGANGGVPAMLEGGEFVVNKEGVRQFGDIISQINNSTGGRALTIDDSRIVQAIASQNTGNKQPLKAYVLYNDIQDTTKLNQKITQLARL